MASTLENRPFQTARFDSMSNGDAAPANTIPFEQNLGQNRWTSNRNIWNNGPRVFKYVSSEAKHAEVFPNRNNSVAVPNASKFGARAPTAESHDTGAIKSAGPFSVPSSTMSNGPHTGTLISPTRLRSNGTLNPDSNPGTASLHRPSLLHGSAPDIEPPSSSPSRPTFGERQGSAIGSRFRPIQGEDSDEFVPSYLQNTEPESNRTRSAYVNTLPHFRNDLASSRSSDLTIQGLPMTQERLQHSSRGNNSMETDGLVRGESNVNQSSNRPTYRPSFDRGLDTGISPESLMYQLSAAPQRLFEFDDQGVSARRKTSSLRPEVASYQPIGFNSGFHSSAIWQSNAMHNDPTKSVARTLSHPRPANWDVMSPTARMAEKILPPGSVTFHADQTGACQQPSHRYGSRFGIVDHAQQVLSVDAQYHNAASTDLLLHQPVNVNSNAQNALHQTPPQVSYNSGHRQYMPDMSRLVLYEPLYSSDHVTDATALASNNRFAQDPDAREARSELLEEFRACHKSKKYELRDIYGHIVEFSGDQNGSRFIQSKLEQANSDEKEQIFSELQTNARQLMTDCFGNYVIQKMFEYGNQSQKKILASNMQGYVLRLSLHAYGCRCVQKAFEHILTDQQATLIRELEGQVLCVVESQHGNHVIQKAVECMPAEHIQFIVEAHRNQVVRLSKNIYGCRIVQRMLEHCVPSAKRMILEELYGAIPMLIDDQYGNYVIQCIISKCSAADRYAAIECVQQKLFYYSTHKFASNVVEKAIQYAEEKQRTDIIRKLTTAHPEFGMQSPVMTLLKDQFGNYVIQTVLKNTTGPARKALADEVRLHLNFMGKTGRSKQVIAMADMLAVITAGHSPSSISTDPHTPRTPTSLHRDSGIESSMGKTIEMVVSGYEMRDQ